MAFIYLPAKTGSTYSDGVIEVVADLDRERSRVSEIQAAKHAQSRRVDFSSTRKLMPLKGMAGHIQTQTPSNEVDSAPVNGRHLRLFDRLREIQQSGRLVRMVSDDLEVLEIAILRVEEQVSVDGGLAAAVRVEWEVQEIIDAEISQDPPKEQLAGSVKNRAAPSADNGNRRAIALVDGEPLTVSTDNYLATYAQAVTL